MPISFPLNPNVNDTYTVNGRTYVWSGTTWRTIKAPVPDVLPTLSVDNDFSAGGVLHVDSENNEIGIGTAAPSHQLHLTQDLGVDGNLIVGGTITVPTPAAGTNDTTAATTAFVQNAISGKQDSSTALTTSTSFGGDVSGTYDAIVISDDSHNHVISNVDGLQTALDAKQDSSTALTTSTAFNGDVSGTYDAMVVADDSHNHIIGNVDGLQTALDAKLPSSSYTAADVLTKIKTVDGAGSGLDADTLDGVQGDNYATKTYVDTAVSNLVDAAPTTLDTLNELAAALGDDPNFATTVAASIGTKLDSSAYTASDVLTKIKTVDGTGSGLDADTLDGVQGANFLRSDTSDSMTGTLTATAFSGPLTGNVTGNASTATKLATARTISLTGDVTGSASFDGSANASITATVADDSHSHTMYIAGTGTVAGTWLGSHPNVSAYYEGLVFTYKIPIAGASTTTLNINSLGALTVYFYGTTKVTTHFPVGSVITLSYSTDNSGCWYAQMYYDTTDDYRIRWQNNITAGALIQGYQLLAEGIDGKYYPVTQGGANSTTNVVSTAELKLGGNILYYETATDIAANASGGAYYLYQGFYSGTMEYWSNRSTTAWATANMPLYLVGTVNANGNFVLDNTSFTSFLTQTLPTTDDGKIYVQLGLMGNTSDTMRLDINHPIYWYKDGALKLYADVPDDSHNHVIANVDGLQTALDGKLGSTANAVSASKLATARTISLTGDVTGSVSFDGSANASITATVADDSHNHIISNVDGLQTALDGKAASSHTHSYLPTSGGTVTGNLDITGYLSVDTLTTTGNVTVGGTISGNGSGLTTLNASNLSTGTVPSARVSGSYTGITDVGLLSSLSTTGTVSCASVDSTGAVKGEGPDGGMVLRNWQANSAYGMLGTANMTGLEYALITDGQTTYVSGGTNGSVGLRPNANQTSTTIEVSSTRVDISSTNGASEIHLNYGSSGITRFYQGTNLVQYWTGRRSEWGAGAQGVHGLAEASRLTGTTASIMTAYDPIFSTLSAGPNTWLTVLSWGINMATANQYGSDTAYLCYIMWGFSCYVSSASAVRSRVILDYTGRSDSNTWETYHFCNAASDHQFFSGFSTISLYQSTSYTLTARLQIRSVGATIYTDGNDSGYMWMFIP